MIMRLICLKSKLFTNILLTSRLNGIKTVGYRYAILTNHFYPLNEALWSLRVQGKFMDELISVEVVNQLLPNFGITKPSSLYERRIRGDNFKADDVLELIEESPYVYKIDWRAWLRDELEHISSSLIRQGVDLSYELNEKGDSGNITIGDKVATISYSPDADDGSFDAAMAAIESVLPQGFEVRASIYNGGNDSNCYAILPRDHWREVEALAGTVVNSLFVPFNHNKARQAEKNLFASLRNFFRC